MKEIAGMLLVDAGINGYRKGRISAFREVRDMAQAAPTNTGDADDTVNWFFRMIDSLIAKEDGK